MALSEQQRSGLGQFLETTLYGPGLAVMHPHAANYFMHGKPPQLTGNSIPIRALRDLSAFAPTTSSSASAMTATSISCKKSASPNSAPITFCITGTASPTAMRYSARLAAVFAGTRHAAVRRRWPRACPRTGQSIRRPAPTPARRRHRRTGTRAWLPRSHDTPRPACAARRRNSASTPAKCCRIRLPKRRSTLWSEGFVCGRTGSAERSVCVVPAAGRPDAGRATGRVFSACFLWSVSLVVFFVYFTASLGVASPVPVSLLTQSLHVIRHC